MVPILEKFHFEWKRDLNLTEMFVEKVPNVMVIEICGQRRMDGTTIDCCISFRSMKMRSFNLVWEYTQPFSFFF